MEPNDEGVTPRRRSLIPGASQESPRADEAEYPLAGDAPTESYQPTEVYEALGEEGHAAPSVIAPDPVPTVPWFRRTWVVATAAGAVVLGVTIGVIVALAGSDNPVAAPSVSPSPTETSPTPTASAEPAAPTLLDDGIADDEYPVSAPSAGPDYPNALVMENWVWDRVGPTWSLVSVGNFDASAGTSGPSVIYLASPEGVLFDLVHVNDPGGIAQVVSWLPSERKARIQISQVASDTSPGGALVDLQTGAVEKMSFKTDTGQSLVEFFLAASSGGAELWSAQDADYRSVRYESWTPSGGWKRVMSEPDIIPWTVVSSPDGSVVAGEIFSTDDSGFRSARSGPPGQPAIVILNVDTGAQTVVRPIYDSVATRWCNLYGVAEEGAPILSCWNESSGDQTWLLATDGKPLNALRADAVQLPMNFWELSWADIPALGISVESAAHDGQVYEVAVANGAASVPVLKAGVDIPYGGLSQFRATKVAEGVVFVEATDACAVIDTENAHGVPLATTKNGIIGCVAYGFGNGTASAYPYGGEGG